MFALERLYVHVDETRVVVYVVLPDGRVLDFVDRFIADNPGYFELGDRSAPGQLPVVLEQIAEMISVIPVGFPDGGVFDVVDHFMKTLQVTSSW